MKHVLILGKNGYIALALKKWFDKYEDLYHADMLSVRGEKWRYVDFSKYDTVCCLIGLAHQKETKENAEMYFEINYRLVMMIANKAKNEGVGQFVLLSSMSVYGDHQGAITQETSLCPNTNYGKSKLLAEKAIQAIENEKFKAVIIRPPMVYGKGCKGNYNRLAKLSKKILVFPKVDNLRSMIYIDNLCEFIRRVIDEDDKGIFHPQNRELVNTTEMVKVIAEAHGNKVRIIKGLRLGIILLIKFPGKLGRLARKVFGSNYYDLDLSKYRKDYQVCDFYESICQSESE